METFDREVCGFGWEAYQENKESRDLRDRFAKKLIVLSLLDDDPAFDLLIRLFWTYWCSWIRHQPNMDPNRMDHSEYYIIISAALSKAYRHRASFKGENAAGVPCRFFTWMHKILQNEYYRWLRCEIEQRKGKQDVSVRSKQKPQVDVARARELLRVMTAAKPLSGKLRLAYVLQAVRGLTYEELAGATTTRVQTLWWRVSTAKKQIGERQ